MPESQGNEDLLGLLRSHGYVLIGDGKWEVALAVWRAVSALQPDNAEPLALQVLVLRQLGRHDEALAFADAGLVRHADHARLWVERALVFFVKREWSSAAEAFGEIRHRLPEEPEGYVRGAFTALELGERQQALQIIRAGRRMLPADRGILSGQAELSEHLGQWSDAADAWTALRRLGDERPPTYESELRCLSQAGRSDEAEALLDLGLARHPDHPHLRLEGARVATRRSAWLQAADRWASVGPDGAGIEAPSRVRDAERFLDRDRRSEIVLRPRWGERPTPEDERFFDRLTAASWTIRLNDRPPMATGVRLLPNGAFANYLGGWRSWELRGGTLRLLDDRDIPSVKLSEIAERDDGSLELRGHSFRQRDRQVVVALAEESIPLAKLFSRFESLGDNCEFGLVQRFYGVETMGLYRFNNAPLDRLFAALDEDFAGLADPDCLELHEDVATGEMIGLQETYSFGYHTARFAHDVDLAGLRQGEHRRLLFLRDKLMDDLAGSGKIFVRKGDAIDQFPRIAALAERLRRHGANWLLWVVEEDERNPSGTVIEVAEGLVRGHVEAFAPADAAGRFVPDAWAKICAKTLRLIAQRPPLEASVRSA